MYAHREMNTEERSQFDILGKAFTASQGDSYPAYEKLVLLLEKIYSVEAPQKLDVTSSWAEMGCIQVCLWDEEESDDPIESFTLVHLV